MLLHFSLTLQFEYCDSWKVTIPFCSVSLFTSFVMPDGDCKCSYLYSYGIILYCTELCPPVLYYIAALYLVDWLQSNHGNVLLTFMLICVPANQLTLSHAVPCHRPLWGFCYFFIFYGALQRKLCVLRGQVFQPSVTIWLTVQSDTQIPFAVLYKQQYW